MNLLWSMWFHIRNDECHWDLQIKTYKCKSMTYTFYQAQAEKVKKNVAVKDLIDLPPLDQLRTTSNHLFYCMWKSIFRVSVWNHWWFIRLQFFNHISSHRAHELLGFMTIYRCWETPVPTNSSCCRLTRWCRLSLIQNFTIITNSK